MYLVTLVPTRASPGPCEYGCHLHLTWTWRFWSASETTLDVVTVVPTGLHLDLGTPVPIWALVAPVDHGPQLGKIGTRWLCSTTEPHLDQVTLFPLWVSPCPSDCETHFGLTWTC